MMTTATRNDERTWVEVIGKPTYDALVEMVDALESATTDDERETAERAIQEDPLSVEMRSGWHTPGDPEGNAEEYNILLGTGGPATRIVGRLSDYGEPETAALEVQDWFKPWTEYEETEEAVLLTYARQFYFGE
jgi:hypothetical protein